MNYLDAMMMVGLDIINGERTQSSIYHLLKGKKTSQTIQDAQLFGVSPQFQIYPALSRKNYDQRLSGLLQKDFLAEQRDGIIVVTASGKKALSDFFEVRPVPYDLNGWKYQKSAPVFWHRLTLMIQTASNLIHDRQRFLPVSRDIHIQNWVRHHVKQSNRALLDYTQQIHKELMEVLTLTNFPDTPELVVQKLSGFDMIGLTNQQIAERLGCDAADVYLRFLNSLHFMVAAVEKRTGDYPVLSEMMMLENTGNTLLTKSTAETFTYLSKQYSIEQIAALRNLKKSTIEDHVLEIALLDPDFDMNLYVQDELIKEIRSAGEDSKRLRFIKDSVPEADYFQIRLVLATSERDGMSWRNYFMRNLGIHHSV
ncbi:hypothetical protein KP77_21740 [Jeotgalibacillus alimentarius]|uniref:Helicase Helix-turn-helix domain-containing protein n=1 Tax=Jeotgalibacillus alimentarius TaxID=135826 RepID=A0A0C2VYD7_9BACL|nr:helix-turn-helix domain-containing protein [Jeotgalibacillus alimentarius]KIL48963.1 hypothetical protein KP77_21740 [Jeotgalibacillus alimentarius]